MVEGVIGLTEETPVLSRLPTVTPVLRLPTDEKSGTSYTRTPPPRCDRHRTEKMVRKGGRPESRGPWEGTTGSLPT